MLFKMITIESSWIHYGADVGVKPRQLFVTRSQNLADKVRESFAGLYNTHVSGSGGGDQTGADEDADLNRAARWTADLPSSFADLCAEHFPLFLSFDNVSESSLM